ncbi:MAG TPA: hypothetical protein VFJ68_10280 [Casimicrobiaceae bacterium]|nr:hypothetical protein [Casimicrobiaceae bacterium]
MTIILVVVVAIIGFALGYAMGRALRTEGQRTAPFAIAEAPATEAQIEAPRVHATAAPAEAATPPPSSSPPPPSQPSQPSPSPSLPVLAADELLAADDHVSPERARIIRSYEAEAALLRRGLAGRDAAIEQLAGLAEERRRLFDELAAARSETARYRQLVIDLENNAAPQFFGAGAPDDLKLIVGIGPVLERMLQMMGVTTYRQIARWSERDIDEFDAKLHEFPGRIRRDAWVTQARALHQSKYGESLPLRGRG